MDRFGSDFGFELQKIKDSIKDKYCEDNNIELIRIPYWDQSNIESILENKIKLEYGQL